MILFVYDLNVIIVKTRSSRLGADHVRLNKVIMMTLSDPAYIRALGLHAPDVQLEFSTYAVDRSNAAHILPRGYHPRVSRYFFSVTSISLHHVVTNELSIYKTTSPWLILRPVTLTNPPLLRPLSPPSYLSSL